MPPDDKMTGQYRGLRPWEPGQSGNPAGRGKGARNRLSEAFLDALCADFEEHGVAVIEEVRIKDPVAYIKICASILPKDLNVNTNPLADLSDEELAERLRSLETAINAALGGDAANDDEATEDDAPTDPEKLH